MIPNLPSTTTRLDEEDEPTITYLTSPDVPSGEVKTQKIKKHLHTDSPNISELKQVKSQSTQPQLTHITMHQPQTQTIPFIQGTY